MSPVCFYRKFILDSKVTLKNENTKERRKEEMSSASITEITSYLVGNVGSDSSKAAAQTTGQDTFSQVFDKTGGEKTVVSTQETRTVKSDGESIQNLQ